MKRHSWTVFFSLALVTTACGKASEAPTTVAPGENVIPAEAEEDFAALTKRYEAAKPMTGRQCKGFADEFKDFYDRFSDLRDEKGNRVMTVAWFNAGAVWEECGEFEKAEEVYKAIIQADPKFDLAYNNLGVIYWNRNEEAKALDFFKRAVSANPITKAPRNNLAAALRDKYSNAPSVDGFKEAERNLQTVLAVDSSNQLAYENLARLYYDRGRLRDKSYLLLADLVVTQANRVLSKKNIESADLYNVRGLLFMQQDNQVDALRAFKKAADLEPNHADAHMNIAMISIRFRDYERAEKSLEIALQDPRQKNNAETYLGLGVAQRGQRKYDEAESSFQRALEVNKQDPRPLYNLGVLYQEHIATIQEEFSKEPYTTAVNYFDQFSKRAGNGWKTEVQDAKARIANIEQLLRDIIEMRKLEEEARQLEEAQERAEEEERKRLLELEAQAKAAGG